MVKKLGVNISNISGIDLLYACNLIKDDRNLIWKDLDALKMIYTRQNVAIENDLHETECCQQYPQMFSPRSS